MIRIFLNIIKCLFNGHVFGAPASCPFTGKTYIECGRCGLSEVVA
jgi:hypothetical protein